MSYQTFNFSGLGAQQSAPITVNTGERVRVRLSAETGYAQLLLTVTQSGVTDTFPFRIGAGAEIAFPDLVAGDSVLLVYEGQTATDSAVGVLESLSALGYQILEGPSGNQAVVTSGGALSVQPINSAGQVLTPGTPYDYTAFGSVRVQVEGLSGGDSISFTSGVTSSLAVSNPETLQVMKLTGSFGVVTTTITSNGIYNILGAGGLTIIPTHIGSASTPVITASANQ